tara:strand:+ start:113 stop:1045 length:933 start_codon:yes stop_codon:yes gene_type:complete
MRTQILKQSINENFQFFRSTIISYIISLFLIYLSINVSVYFYFLSIPLLLISIWASKSCFEAISSSYSSLSKNEKYFEDGEHQINFLHGPKQIQYIINIKSGLRHGDYKEYHTNGQLFVKSQYNKGVQYGETLVYYNNGNLYRKFNLKDGRHDGIIEEYYDDKFKNLKFVLLNNVYTFYSQLQNKLFEIKFDSGNGLFTTYSQFIGIWKKFDSNGLLEYELDFDDSSISNENELIKKTFSKDGKILNSKKLSFEPVRGIHANFANKYSRDRLLSSQVHQQSTIMGPPGLSNGFSVEVKLIDSLDDILTIN